MGCPLSIDHQAKCGPADADSWVEERVQWQLRRPVTRAMKDQLDDLLANGLAQASTVKSHRIVDSIYRAGEGDLVQVIDSAEGWEEKNAEYARCEKELGPEFKKARGKPALLFFIQQKDGPRDLVQQVVDKKPELVFFTRRRWRAMTFNRGR